MTIIVRFEAIRGLRRLENSNTHYFLACFLRNIIALSTLQALNSLMRLRATVGRRRTSICKESVALYIEVRRFIKLWLSSNKILDTK